jgi:hypothetical protein
VRNGLEDLVVPVLIQCALAHPMGRQIIFEFVGETGIRYALASTTPAILILLIYA